jgi:hypothetical protein
MDDSDAIRKRFEEMMRDLAENERFLAELRRWEEVPTLGDVPRECLEMAIQDFHACECLTHTVAKLRGEDPEEMPLEEENARAKVIQVMSKLERMRRMIAFDRPNLQCIADLPIQELDRGVSIAPIEFFRGLAMRVRQETGMELDDDMMIGVVVHLHKERNKARE